MTSLALVEQLGTGRFHWQCTGPHMHHRAEPGGTIRQALEDCNHQITRVADAVAYSQTMESQDLKTCATALADSLRQTLRTSVERAAEFVHAVCCMRI